MAGDTSPDVGSPSQKYTNGGWSPYCVIVACVLLGLWLQGCKPRVPFYQPSNNPAAEQEAPNSLISQSYQLADSLIRNMEEVTLLSTHMPIGKDEPILAATFVEVTTLEPDSDFGRIMADQVAARFVQKGYNLLETKLRKDGLLIHDNMGEFLLSRKLQEIGQSFSAAYVIIGTYSVGARHIFMNSKVISVQNSRIVAAGNLEITVTDAIMDLLQTGQKIYIKHLTNESIH